MSGYFIIVLVPGGTEDIVDGVGKLLAPYEEPLVRPEEPVEGPKPTWDGWCIGGPPFDGCVRGEPSVKDGVDDASYARGHVLKGNVIPVNEVPDTFADPEGVAAVVTPDGRWHHYNQELYELFGTDASSLPDDLSPEWRGRRNEILGKHKNCLAVGVRLHI